MEKQRAEGQVALVTGGASGLGKASAAALNAHGATTIICDIQKDQIKRSVADITDATGSQLGSYVCDVRQKEQVKECVDHIDGNQLNNNSSSLRWATRTQNLQNRRKQANCTSKFKGVSWNKPLQNG